MKKHLFSFLFVSVFGLVLFGEETASPATSEFGFDFVGILTDVSNTTRNLDFALSTTNRTAVPVWGRKIAVAVASNGFFSVRLANGSGQPLVSQVTNLAAAVERIGKESMILTVTDGGKSFGVSLPPVEIAGIAERALGASGDFNAAQGLVVTELTTASIGAERVVAERLSSQSAVKASGALAVNGKLQAKGTLQSVGPVTAKTLDIRKSATVTSALETKNALAVRTVKDIKTLAVGTSLSVGGVNVVVPEGTIVAWNRADGIPAGWVICNGENGTPNMRNRFVVGGGDGYVPGDQQKGYGGADFVQLTMNQMPAHTHRLPYYTGKIWPKRWTSYKEVRGISSEYGDTGTRTIDNVCGPSSGTGTLGDAHENRPPYYALVFIMKKYGGAK